MIPEKRQLQWELYINPVSDVDDLFGESHFLNALYNVFLENKDKEYNWPIEIKDTFNEWLYLLTRLSSDKHPESNIKNYLDECRYSFGRRYVSNCIFAMVDATVTAMEVTPPNLTRFKFAFESCYISKENPYITPFVKFAEEYKKEHGGVSIQFPRTFGDNVKREGAFDDLTWESATNDFDQDFIRDLMKVNAPVAVRRAILENIENAFNGDLLPF